VGLLREERAKAKRTEEKRKNYNVFLLFFFRSFRWSEWVAEKREGKAKKWGLSKPFFFAMQRGARG
jgi:hypothetical protein